MLKGFRKHTKSIIIVTVIAMGGWGVFTLGSGLGDQGRIAGRVFGKPVYFQEYNLFRKMSQIFATSEQPITDPEILNMKTWQNIILAKEAKRLSIKVSDEEVRNEIYKLLQAQKIENPSPELYKRWLKSALNEEPKDFEKKIRELLRIQKLIEQSQGVEASPTDEEIRDLFLKENRNLSLEMILFENREEAAVLNEKINKSELDWDQAKEENTDLVRATGNVSLDAIINLWQVPEEDAYRLHEMDIDAIDNAPLSIGKKFGIVKVLDKQYEDEEKFDQEKYRNKIVNRARQLHFFEWGQNLQQKAQLEDYIPSPTRQDTASPDQT